MDFSPVRDLASTIKRDGQDRERRMTLADLGGHLSAGDYEAATKSAFAGGLPGVGFRAQQMGQQERQRVANAEEKRLDGIKSQVRDLAMLGLQEQNPRRQAAIYQKIRSFLPEGATVGPEYDNPRDALALIAVESGGAKTLFERQQQQRLNARQDQRFEADQAHRANTLDLERQRLDIARKRASQRRQVDPLAQELKRERIAEIQAKRKQRQQDHQAGVEETRAKADNLRAGLENLAVTSKMEGFNASVGQYQGGEASFAGTALRNVNDLLAPGGQREIRAKISGDTRALSAAIKPLIRKPGEGTFTDADQRQLDEVLGDLSEAQNATEFKRRLLAVRDRIEANFGLRLGPLSFEKVGKKDQSRVTPTTPTLPPGYTFKRID